MMHSLGRNLRFPTGTLFVILAIYEQYEILLSAMISGLQFVYDLWDDLESSHVDSKRTRFFMGGRGFWPHSYAINQKKKKHT